jgi:hypothetical protein
MKAKYDLSTVSTVSNPIKCKRAFSISVYYTSCVECASFMVLQQRLNWISFCYSLHFFFNLHLVLCCVLQGTKQKIFH